MSFIHPSQRLRRLPSQFFARLVASTQTLQTAGHDVINLGQGNPDLPTPAHIVAAAHRAVDNPATHKYSPFSGLKALRGAAATWYESEFNVALDPETEICILIGAKLGLQEISLCLLDEGDLCLMPDPGYPDYCSGVALTARVRSHAAARRTPLSPRPFGNPEGGGTSCKTDVPELPDQPHR